MRAIQKRWPVAMLVGLLVFAACTPRGASVTSTVSPAATVQPSAVPSATAADPVDAFLTAASVDLSGDERAVRARLTDLAHAHGLEPDYLVRNSECPTAWAGAVRIQSAPSQIAAAFFLWQQEGGARWEAFRAASPFFPYLVNPPRGLRLQERAGTLEMGLATFNLGSSKDAWFVLARLQAGNWQEVWSPAQAKGQWGLGAPGVVEFVGAGYDRLRVAGPPPADLATEAASCQRQLYETEWQRQGDTYVRVSARCVPPGTDTVTPTPAATSPGAAVTPGLGWQVVRDDVISNPYYWVINGLRVDRVPQISPDGSKLAYLPMATGSATDADRLVVRDLTTGKDLDLTPEPGYLYTSARWSPDGKSLAFIKYRYAGGQGTPTELWLIAADGQNARKLYQLGPCERSATGPAFGISRWSADSQAIEIGGTVFDCAGSARQLSVRADGSGTTPLTWPDAAAFGAGAGAPMTGAWAPSGDYVLAAVKTSSLKEMPANAPADGQTLVRLDLSTGRSAILGSFPGVIYLDHGCISPDGEWIAFRTVVFPVSGPPTEPAVEWVVRRDGSGLRQVTENGQPVQHGNDGPLWADGGLAYFRPSREDARACFLALDANQAQVVPVASAIAWTALASVSRDGRRLVTIGGEWDKATLHVLELAPATGPVPAVAPANTSAPLPTFGPERKLLDLTPPGSEGFVLSPDGHWLAYYTPEAPVDGRTVRGAVVARNLETGASVVLFEQRQEEARILWFPDSQRVLILDQRTAEVRSLGADPAQVALRLPEGATRLDEAAISPDGQRLAYTVAYAGDSAASATRVGVFVVTLADGVANQIVAPAGYVSHPAWSADGQWVLYYQGDTSPDDGATFAVPANGGDPMRIITRARLVSWSPDGKLGLWLGVPANASGKHGLWVAPLTKDTSAWRLYGGVDARDVCWLNGDTVVYAWEGALYAIKHAANAESKYAPVRLLPEDERALAPQWVPGLGLFYAAQPYSDAVPSLRLLPLADVRQ